MLVAKGRNGCCGKMAVLWAGMGKMGSLCCNLSKMLEQSRFMRDWGKAWKVHESNIVLCGSREKNLLPNGTEPGENNLHGPDTHMTEHCALQKTNNTNHEPGKLAC